MTKFREIAGKTALITGAARGIGQGCAEALAAEGVHVVLADVLPEVQKTWEDIHARYPENQGFALVVDISAEEQVRSMIDQVVEKLGKLDIIYNNAGINGGEWEISDVTEEVIDKVFGVNLKGTMFCCKYAAIQMKKQRFGAIVNTGSFYGKVGHARSGLYGSSKAAIHTLTQALALEMAPYGVTVNAVCPALAATEMHWAYLRKEAAETGVSFEELTRRELPGIPLGRLGTGADSAGAIAWLASESGSYVTGQLINVNGGLDFT